MNPAVIEAVQTHPCFHCLQPSEAEQEQCAGELARAVLTAAVDALPSYWADGVVCTKAQLRAALLGPPGHRDGAGT